MWGSWPLHRASPAPPACMHYINIFFSVIEPRSAFFFRSRSRHMARRPQYHPAPVAKVCHRTSGLFLVRTRSHSRHMAFTPYAERDRTFWTGTSIKRVRRGAGGEMRAGGTACNSCLGLTLRWGWGGLSRMGRATSLFQQPHNRPGTPRMLFIFYSRKMALMLDQTVRV